MITVTEDGTAGEGTARPRRLRRLWLSFGHACFAVGAVGAFVPLLPTAPLWLLAAWAYAKSSPALRDRLHAHPRFGPALQAWHDRGAISRRGKAASVVGLTVSWAIAAALAETWTVPAILAAVFLAVSAFVLSRPQP